jgi:gliding motility-associated-like protein
MLYLGRYYTYFKLRGDSLWLSPLFYSTVLGIILCSSAASAQNLITNSSFEEGQCETKDFINRWSTGVGKASSWLLPDTIVRECGVNSCVAWNGTNYAFIQDKTAPYDTFINNSNSKCCGKGCHQLRYTSRLTSSVAIKGNLQFDSLGFNNRSPYIGQKLTNPIISNHLYYHSLFYNIFSYSAKHINGEWAWYNEYQAYPEQIPTPNTSHNGFGVAFSSYHMIYKDIPHPQDGMHRVLPSVPNQRKLRHTLQYQPYWQKLAGTFVADSAYAYLTIGNFWTTAETTFTPPLSDTTVGTSVINIDSVNMWDVTHQIQHDTQYCIGQDALLTSEHYSRGYTVWYTKQGDLLYTGDTFSLTLTSNTFVRSIRYFPEIDYSTTDSVYLTVKNKPLLLNLSRANDPCTLPATYTVQPQTGYTYMWNSTLGTNQYTAIDSQTIHLLVTDTNGCYIDTSFFVWPEVAFSAALLSDTCDLTTEIVIEPDTYEYTVNGALSGTRYLGNVSGRVILIATQANGCKDTQYLNIPLCTVQAENIWIPSGFSPNNDGLNPRFAPVSKYIKSYTLTVYSRWGEKLFISSDNNWAWDGTYLGKPVQQGSYFYTLDILLLNNQRLQRKGQITLLR